MASEELEELAASDAHARWILEEHLPYHDDPDNRRRCAICDEWYPCDLVNLAALAVLNAERRERAEAEAARLREVLAAIGHEVGELCAATNEPSSAKRALTLVGWIQIALAPPPPAADHAEEGQD